MKQRLLYLTFFLICTFAHAEWKINFDESASKLTAQNKDAYIQAIVSFKSGDKKWSIANSRDGVKNRLAILKDDGDVQGYIVFPQNSDTLEILFYHRTAQAYKGTLSLDAVLQFKPDAFACKTKPSTNERVLPLNFGNADSKLNDSVFSPSTDCAVRIEAENLNIVSRGVGKFEFCTSGEISEAGSATFKISRLDNYFKNRYVPYYTPLNRGRCPKTPTGWMSWNTYFDKATAEDNLSEARIGQKFLQPFGCEFWSIESWQENSDQLPVSKFYNMDLETNPRQFPKGMKDLATEIRKLGFRPGLWVAPFGTGNDKFYENHKDWFLHDAQGKPISCWNGKYTLDPTVPEARKHLENIFRKASREWDYEFFKIDGMSGRNKSYCAHLYERPEIRARFKNPDCANPFELCVKAFRDGIGEDRIFLACQGHTSGAEAGYADLARTGADIVHPNKPVMWNNVLLQARCTINQIFTHNISLIADPDTLLVNDLPIEQARTTATIVALPAQLTFFGDKLANLAPQKMKILQQTLPVPTILPMNIYPQFNMCPLWNLSVRNIELGDYNVVAFFNWSDKDTEISADAKELGIAKDAKYHCYEFWTQNYLGIKSLPLTVNVPARGVRLVVITPAKDIPQFIGSDRHIAQTGSEIKSLKWNDAQSLLSGEIELIQTYPLSIFVSLPQNFKLDSAEAQNANCIVENRQDCAKITFVKNADNHSKTVKFKIKFLEWKK